ncbi:MAG: leucine-rich repeat domain-containing protein, partial [Treponema sp.]|nr:leucine-rich repeat domain-containing protein [Treponema sp.]
GEYAFIRCRALAEIHYAGTKEQWAAVEKGDDWNEEVPAKEVLYTGGDAPEFEIADGVLTKYNGSSSAVTIPEEVKSIGKAAFYKCEALASVIIPDGGTEIGVCAFGGCTSLASVSIPGSMTKICEAAFNVCTALASVTIPGSVTEIGKGAFCGCTALAEIHFGGTKEQWAAVKKGEGWNEDVPAKEVLVRKQ